MEDKDYIRLAIQQAKKGMGQTSPNPSVGAVIVANGEIVGEGFHAKAGTPHAERLAIADAENRGFTNWSAATIYVTLEPCSTHGRTGACSDAIRKKGFKRVVYGSVDPNPAHVGQADSVLKGAGIQVSSGVERDSCDWLIRGFSKVQRKGLPWVIIKSAMSLDGKISRPKGEGQWLTNKEARHEVHLLRAEVDAVITGGNTVRQDNPKLTVRLPDRAENLRQPKRVILTRDRSSLPSDSFLMQDADTLIYETAAGLEPALRDLSENHGVNTVLIEAGGGLLGQFCDARLVDEVVMFYAPMLTGGAPMSVAGNGAEKLSDAIKLEQVSYTRLADDVMMRGIVTVLEE